MFCFSAAVISISAAAAASSTSYAIDPAAEKILDQMQTSYSELNSLSEQVTAGESPNLPHSIAVHTLLKMLRPGYVSMTSDSKSARSGASEVVTDGAYCYVTAPQYPSRYLKFPIPASVGALRAALGQGITSSLTLALFSQPDTVSAMFSPRRLATLHLGKPVKIDGVTTQVVVSSDTDGVTLTLFIDQSDHLLRRAIAIDPNKAGDFTETYSSIQVNPALTASSFSFTAPAHTEPFYGTSFGQATQDSPGQ
jgi:outer membrane lipoprotein-sorting protein